MQLSPNKQSIITDATCVPTIEFRNTFMKKTYITPAVETIKVDVANMMATSMPIVDGTVNTNNIADQLSREMNRSAELLEQLWQ